MLYLYTGTDREKARSEMNKSIARIKKQVVRVTDANAVADLQEILRGSGMFAIPRVVVFEEVLLNEEMRDDFLAALPVLERSSEPFFVFEEKPDAHTRKLLEKHAEKSERYDRAKEKKGSGIFSLADALRKGDKKSLWVEYQRALTRDEAPEAIHGVLFWGAKTMFLRSRGKEQARAAKLVAELAELPHKARRRGFELEYALEHYLLGVNKS